MIIHLIRHGKTKANQEKLYCGSTDLPLSSNGIEELMELKNLNIYPKEVDTFCTSGLLRTNQTLEILYGTVESSKIPQFAEFNFGEFEMKSYEMLKHQKDYLAWITDETGVIHCPGGENKEKFSLRVLE